MLARNKIINKFKLILDDEKTSELIEESIYNYTIQENQLPQGQNIDDNEDILLFYMEKSRSIYDNLNPNSYFDNKEGLLKFQKNIITQPCNDIKEFRYKTLWKIIKQNQEILDKNLMELKPTSETDQFLCTKCKKRKTTFYTMQIRSSDEPETCFITCLNCSYSWREG